MLLHCAETADAPLAGAACCGMISMGPGQPRQLQVDGSQDKENGGSVPGNSPCYQRATFSCGVEAAITVLASR